MKLRRDPDRPRFKWVRRYEGVRAFCGPPGAGKTYELAAWALARQAEGRPVWCSAGFGIPECQTFGSVDEFLQIPPGSAIAVDEAPNWFDARAWQSIDRNVVARLMQVRKPDLVMAYTCMSPSMVEIRLRQITVRWTECRALAHRYNKVREMKSPKDAPQLRAKNSNYRLRRMRDDVLTAYDTLAESDTGSWRSVSTEGGAGRPPKPKDEVRGSAGATGATPEEIPTEALVLSLLGRPGLS